MIARVELVTPKHGRAGSAVHLLQERLRARFGAVLAQPHESSALPALEVALRRITQPGFDLLELDRHVHAFEDRGMPFELAIELDELFDWEALAIEQILTRYQRLLVAPPGLDPRWAAISARHRALHQLDKPLVRADYDHAVDTWRWLLWLEPRASVELQVAALFHDLERLLTEADERVEQHAPNYGTFKAAHAARGARWVRQILGDAGLTPRELERSCRLIELHEQPAEDAELAALNDADALSFFSLNSWGFVRYFDADHTRLKLAYTLSRMTPRALSILPRLRLPPAMCAMLEQPATPPMCAMLEQPATRAS